MGEKEYRMSLPELKDALNNNTVTEVYHLDIACNFKGLVIKLSNGQKITISEPEDWGLSD